MTDRSARLLLPACIATALVATAPAGAAVIATPAVGSNEFYSVSTDDAADVSEGATVSFVGAENFASDADTLIDGAVYNGGTYGNTNNTLAPSVGNVLTINLAPGDGQGWDISSIVVLSGVNIGSQLSRSDHGYSIELSTDGTNFDPAIINVSDTNNAAEVRMTITDDTAATLGSGIKAVRFTFSNATGSAENMYREIDVFGTAVPEPGALALLGAGGLILLRRRR